MQMVFDIIFDKNKLKKILKEDVVFLFAVFGVVEAEESQFNFIYIVPTHNKSYLIALFMKSRFRPSRPNSSQHEQALGNSGEENLPFSR